MKQQDTTGQLYNEKLHRQYSPHNFIKTGGKYGAVRLARHFTEVRRTRNAYQMFNASPYDK
jgi:hypothetical protein